jgi:hypothetical protein
MFRSPRAEAVAESAAVRSILFDDSIDDYCEQNSQMMCAYKYHSRHEIADFRPFLLHLPTYSAASWGIAPNCCEKWRTTWQNQPEKPEPFES